MSLSIHIILHNLNYYIINEYSHDIPFILKYIYFINNRHGISIIFIDYFYDNYKDIIFINS